MSLLDSLDAKYEYFREIGRLSKTLVTISTIVGALLLVHCFIKALVSLFHGFRLYVLSQVWKTDYRKRYGQWAVISGATDGIGLEFAKELARRGHSIIVIGRNDVKLTKTKLMLEAQPNVGEVETIKIDLADSSLENYQRIKPQIDPEKRDIGILVNNAGALSTIARLYNIDMDKLRAEINVSVLATVYLTRMILPGMVARGRGLIVNMSSIYGTMSGPFLGVYAPTKHFMNCFSRQLNIEYAKYPVDIINLTPGVIKTKLYTDHSDPNNPLLFCPTAKVYAKSALNACSTRNPEFFGLPIHAITYNLLDGLGLVPFIHWATVKFYSKGGRFSPSPTRRINGRAKI